jgi:hypothetical protein
MGIAKRLDEGGNILLSDERQLERFKDSLDKYFRALCGQAQFGRGISKGFVAL